VKFRVLATGGTIDKVYFDAASTYEVGEPQVAPLLREVDTLWIAGRDGRAPIGPAMVDLRQGGPVPDPEALAGWLEAHDTLLIRLVGVDLPLAARGAQRQGVVAVTLSRDAVEVLARAAEQPSGPLRDELAAESIRLRVRAEQVILAVEASVDDLRGERRRLSVLPPLPGFAELVG
jgi:phage terminase large subunit-like protein